MVSVQQTQVNADISLTPRIGGKLVRDGECIEREREREKKERFNLVGIHVHVQYMYLYETHP